MNEQINDSIATQTAQEHQVQFLGFCVGDEEYGVDILKVQEIRSWEPVTRIPNAPVYEKGVINLRGSIIPIIDLREKFGVRRIEYTATTVVIVLQAGHRIMGVVVDSVSNVIDVDKQSIQKPPEVGSKMNADYINGLISVNNRMVVLLNIDTLLTLETADNLTNSAMQNNGVMTHEN